jgi:hypothetical protein
MAWKMPAQRDPRKGITDVAEARRRFAQEAILSVDHAIGMEI